MTMPPTTTPTTITLLNVNSKLFFRRTAKHHSPLLAWYAQLVHNFPLQCNSGCLLCAFVVYCKWIVFLVDNRQIAPGWILAHSRAKKNRFTNSRKLEAFDLANYLFRPIQDFKYRYHFFLCDWDTWTEPANVLFVCDHHILKQFYIAI